MQRRPRDLSPNRMWCVGVALTALALVSGCESGGSSISGGDAQAATRDAVDLEQLDIGPWRPVTRPELVDPIIVNQCANPRGSKRMPTTGLVAGSSSPVRWYKPDPFFGQNGVGFGVVQVTAARYVDEQAARSAASTPDSARLTSCVIDAIRRRWLPLQPFDESTAAGETGVSLTSGSIDSGTMTTKRRNGTFHTIDQRFPEEMIGGFDNYHDLAETIGQSGSIVTTAFVASASQQGDPQATQALAQRLAAAALERAATDSAGATIHRP